MSGLEATLVLELVPATYKLVKLLTTNETNADHFINIAMQVDEDLNLAKKCFWEIRDFLRPHEDLKKWLNTTIRSTQQAFDDFIKHLPIVREDKHRASMSQKVDYFFNQEKVADLEKPLKYSHSALLTAIGLMGQASLHKSAALVDQKTKATRASSMPPRE